MTLPQPFLERMRASLGDGFDAFCAAYDKPPQHGFRVNTLKISADALAQLFEPMGERVPWCETGYYYEGGFGKHPCHRAGLFYSQEPSAMIAAELLAPQDGERVLDLCAAPGGKSTQIAAAMQGTGMLVANEIVPSRARILAENLERMGVRNTVVTCMSPDALASRFPRFFDRILVDAPCSGEGMFRKDETAVREWSIAHTESCAVRQSLILESAAAMLAEGGMLVYSTCTFSPQENEGVVQQFLQAHPDFVCDETHILLPHRVRGEGHFAAKLRGGSGARVPRPPAEQCEATPLYRAFEAECLHIRLEGAFVAFGDLLYLLPDDFGTPDGVKIVRAGLLLGEHKKNRFEPSHALCMALRAEDFRRTLSLEAAEVDAYYRGESKLCDGEAGWGACLFASHPIGWYKCANGQAKNHLPKYLRA